MGKKKRKSKKQWCDFDYAQRNNSSHLIEEQSRACRHIMLKLQALFGSSLDNEAILAVANDCNFVLDDCLVLLSQLTSQTESKSLIPQGINSNISVPVNVDSSVLTKVDFETECKETLTQSFEALQVSNEIPQDTIDNSNTLVGNESIDVNTYLEDSYDLSESDKILKLIEILPEVDPQLISEALVVMDHDFDASLSLLISRTSNTVDTSEYPEDVKTLLSIFPLFDPLILLEIFHENNQDCNQAINCLLADTTNEEKSCRLSKQFFNIAERIKFQNLKVSFPNVGEDLILEIFLDNDCCFVPTKDSLSTIFGPSNVVPAILPQHTLMRRRSILSPKSSALKYKPAQIALDELYRKKFNMDKYKVENEVALKQEFEHLSQSRSRLLHQATNAFHNRQSAHASIIATNARSQMRSCQEVRELLAVAILGRNNPNLMLLNSIDLHELRLDEALILLRDQFRRVRKAYPNRKRSVSIIVGVGKHSRITGQSVLGPAVIKMLVSSGVEYCEPHPGTILAYLH